jgi:hypothetical protein
MTGARLGLLAVTCGLAVAPARPARAQPATRAELRLSRAASPPTIDGYLDDEVWLSAPVPADEWRSYDPLYGDTVPQRTTVWVTYDAENLYVAFRCDDPEPDQVKTSVSRRDSIGSDDWVGLSLDALGSGQLSYHMMVNPSGVQLDMLNSVAGDEDSSVDWVWDSAGHLTETGYAVDIRLPLRSIRFKGGADTKMGILFWRRISRLGVSVSWPPLAPGQWVFERNASAIFDNLEPRLPRDVIPSLTASDRQVRETPDRWAPADRTADVGLSAKLGITPTVTLDVTANPDFSQVESDAFEVEVNQRFPVFYSEKRPFFMEGAGIFTIAGSGSDNSLQAAVHTRTIIDPVAGAKLTGSLGRVTFGTLTAVDQAPGRAVAATSPDAGKSALFNIARAQYSLGPSNYVGGLFTDREFAGGFNRVAGADLSWRITPSQRATAFVLGSTTRPAGNDRSASAIGAEATYAYSTSAVTVSAAIEHYGRGFQMDTAFINRVGITSGWIYAERNFYPDKARYPWLRRVTPFIFTQGGRDRTIGGNDLIGVAGFRFSFTRQGFIRIDRSWGFEPWAGRRFERGRTRAWGNVQLYRWLNADARYTAGRAVYYDAFEPFAGRSREAHAGMTLQPNGRLSQTLSYTRVAFDRAGTSVRVYSLDILNTKTTYQFTRQVFVRGIAQYDSSRSRILTDLLLSYELNPGTVAYIGYGSLLEQRRYADGVWVPGEGTYRASERGLIAKVSYLHHF